ncbi:hypothetical protein B0A48_01441 [Cryoendolithus antarcticus]|uniref:Uncharacterized protein n=1 Tax=Cryoendolithus antarcticus TaxID=1507870 RepID=A0A1V8TP98_9PEZI|nr:hypothetical protein B0A48_01441 [Cryoendolithus antarcticus]
MASDLTTRSDFGRIANARSLRSHRLDEKDQDAPREESVTLRPPSLAGEKGEGVSVKRDTGRSGGRGSTSPSVNDIGHPKPLTPLDHLRSSARSLACILTKFSKFIGPGFMVSVAYIDPGNYATDVAAGASYRFRLLFMILLSNLFAIFLQSLCIKLGSVTGMNLAEMIKAHCPPWLNYVLYFFAESAIIATDIAEVIGTAIALNLLLKIPLVAGCAISIVDVLFILLFYRPTTGSLRGLRAFELFVMLLVLGVVICFCFQLSMIDRSMTSAREVFAGYLPSKALVESKGLYQACGILGATVMPHSLYLGSGIIQARLKDFDRVHMPPVAAPDAAPNHTETETSTNSNTDENEPKYRPSLTAIHSCLTYSIVELSLCLFTFALFVNSAILIVAGAALYNTPGAEDADLFGIHALLASTLAPVAGTVFALALLLSGTSAGIVCTIAGQMVSEGQLNLRIRPWLRRLMTRSISIVPSIIIAGAVGGKGLSAALQGSQVALSVILPFVSAPVIYFTCRDKFMSVEVREGENGEVGGLVKMRNHWFVAVLGVVIWLVVVIMNVALLVLVGLGVK